MKVWAAFSPHRDIRHMTVLSRVAGWVLIFAIIFLSLIPPAYRPITRMGHSREHFLIFLAVGFALGLGYANRCRGLTLSLVAFAAAIELAQLFAPGRHARVVDFVVDATAGCVGVALSWIATRAKRALSGNRS